MQIARSKQDKIDKLVTREFTEVAEESKEPRGRLVEKSLKMDVEGVNGRGSKDGVAESGAKMICGGCDLEIVNTNSGEDYYAECTDCGSFFCR